MVQEAILSVLTCVWLGGLGTEALPGQLGRLLSVEEVGEIFGGEPVPCNFCRVQAYILQSR
jgi:hypothetical protein